MQTTGIHLWVVLWKAYDSMRAHAERHIESLGMCLSDFGVLETILHRGPTPVNAIGEKIGLTSGSITTAVDRLEDRGLVERSADPADRRTRVVHLTAAGRKLAASALREHEEAMERAAAGLNAVERGQAVALLKKLGIFAQQIME